MKRTEINEIGNRKEKNETKRNVDSLKKKINEIDKLLAKTIRKKTNNQYLEYERKHHYRSHRF